MTNLRGRRRPVRRLCSHDTIVRPVSRALPDVIASYRALARHYIASLIAAAISFAIATESIWAANPPRRTLLPSRTRARNPRTADNLTSYAINAGVEKLPDQVQAELIAAGRPQAEAVSARPAAAVQQRWSVRGEVVVMTSPTWPAVCGLFAVDIEGSTRRNNLKAELRSTLYRILEEAWLATRIYSGDHDSSNDSCYGVLMPICLVADAIPDTLPPSSVVPVLTSMLAVHNSGIPLAEQSRRLRLRIALDAGEVQYSVKGPFWLLAARELKTHLRNVMAPLAQAASDDIYPLVVRHGYAGIDDHYYDSFNYRSDGELMLILLRALTGYTPGPGTPGGNYRLSKARAPAVSQKFDTPGGSASGLLPRPWPGTTAGRKGQRCGPAGRARLRSLYGDDVIVMRSSPGRPGLVRRSPEGVGTRESLLCDEEPRISLSVVRCRSALARASRTTAARAVGKLEVRT
jgi:hypothetical protein